MESESVAAAMIRRFREAKPSSRAERDSAKLSGRVREMWWVDDESKGRNDRQVHTPSRNHERPGASMELEYPRPSPLKPTVMRPPARNSSTMRSIDDLIMKDIMGTSDSLDWDTRRKTAFGGDDLDKSIDSVAGRREGPTYRFDGGRDEAVKFRKSGEALLNESLETLGSIGFHGLNAPDLKLDGAKDKMAKVSTGQMQDVNASLEELLKTLGANKENLTKEGFPESIMQVYNDVNANLIGFKSKFEERYEKEDAEAKVRAERDEEMKRIGREEERETMLKQITKMEIENNSRLSKHPDVLDSSSAACSDSECLNTSVEADDAPVDQQVHDLRSALQIRMRHLEKLHADAMQATFTSQDKALTEAEDLTETAIPVQADISKVEKQNLLYGLAKDPFLNIPSGRERNLHSNRKSNRSHSTSRRTGQRRNNSHGEISEDIPDADRRYISPDPAIGNAPGILHDSVVSAAKYITLNLNVAMDGLHHRLPGNSVSPFIAPVAPPVADSKHDAEVPTYAEVTGDFSGPQLPTYDEIHPSLHNVTPTPRLPTYDEVIGPSSDERHPSVPAPKFVPPLSDTEKMTMEIDRVLGPANSSLEETELAWWRLNDANTRDQQTSATWGRRQLHVPHNVVVSETKTHHQSKPWLVAPSHQHTAYSDRPSAPVFPLPDPPALPERIFDSHNELASGTRGLPSYLGYEEPIKYHTAREGLALRSVRPGPDEKKTQIKSDAFSSEAPKLGSPTSVITGNVSWSERELYLKRMQHYRATLSGAVL